MTFRPAYINRYTDRRNYAAAILPTEPVPANHPRWIAYVAAQPVRAQWIEAKRSTFDFAASMFAAVMRFGDLTERQGAAVDRCIDRDAQRAAQSPSGARTAVSAEFPNIRAFVDQGVSSGLRRVALTVGSVAISLAPMTGRNPGALYVKWHGEYAGKIVGTTFQPGRDIDAAALIEILREIEANPAQMIARHGIETGVCGCCGMTLTDPVSIARGIGPICFSRWSF